jgi:hypothetical protein
MDNFEEFDLEDEEDPAMFDRLDELEKLETVILLMEELRIETLTQARERFDTIERAIDPE